MHWWGETADGGRGAKVGTALMGTGRRLAHQPVAGFPWTAPTWPTGVERLPEKSDLGPDYDTTLGTPVPRSPGARRLLDGVGRPAVRALARPEVNGLDRIDHIDTPVVIAPNHAEPSRHPAAVDVLARPHAAQDRRRGGRGLLLRQALEGSHVVLRHRCGPHRAHPDQPKGHRPGGQHAGRGWNVVLYPEGTRSPDGWATPHKAGAALVAMRGDRPVLPVHLEGTARIIPREGGLHPGRTAVTFGRPMSPHEGENVRAFAAGSRQKLPC